MSRQLVQQPFNIQNENSNIIPNKTKITEKRKNSKLPLGKVGSGLGSRKALNDITNKPNIHHETSTRKKNSTKEEVNIAEEKFLHDHKKCIEAQQTLTESVFLDIVLPGHGSVPSQFLGSHPPKIDDDTPSCYPEPVELPMSEFSDWLEFAAPSPDSPLHLDSPPCSPHAWEFEAVEFFLKPESYS